MSVLQLNPKGMTSTTEGFISSITIRNGGSDVVYTPDADGRIGATGNALANPAYTNVLSGQRSKTGGTLTPVQA